MEALALGLLILATRIPVYVKLHQTLALLFPLADYCDRVDS